jgi:hypothetical protein
MSDVTVNELIGSDVPVGPTALIDGVEMNIGADITSN